ncbi:precorrin-6y C5,15-methyltransferase (decarboxylating) subunit CbiE [Nisaea acidiphila]|uniref:Precorrin-6y C5,15-methyltransferase (Decarboxylating) subunit CbiE n=1 Tax=Nisaea acidiphila TaxID=1862145 RepID=A0A9J7APR7_9PROT|nr:precorrin-6y C5,15-methyltransferase (decarboxylating) subunit CbiE [Nisaea acidiphila]UUX48348.1 precorrin-6y C5,15-methyltransferase (decarboxylating) subunit CbiE [Nisaea acidiphila]
MRTETPWLRIIGIGEDGLDGLSRNARELLKGAEILIGGARHLAMLPEDGRERIEWPSPLQDFIDRIHELRGRKVAVLATGDPMQHGIGATLAKILSVGEMVVIPTPSAFSLAAARLGWPLAEVRILTVHGRPLSLLAAALQPGAKLILLSEGRETPGQVAAFLTGAGFGKSAITVFEHMGGPKEARLEGSAEDWPHAPGADFNTVAIQLSGPSKPLALGTTPGLDDSFFESDGQLTKREVRAVTLAALRPGPGQLLWDVGAGSGSIAIEWMRTDPLARAIAVEPRSDRIENIRRNAETLGVPFLKIVEGTAPDALDGLEEPDAVFLGGGITAPGLLEICWNALKPGGRLVANVVTLEGEAELTEARATLGGELTRIAVSRLEPVGPYHGWRPLMPVTQWSARKPGAPRS